MGRITVLFVSDLHYRPDAPKGDPAAALGFQKLMEIVRSERPDLIVGAGDWDLGFDKEAFEELAEVAYVLTIYGNHENREGIYSARNVDGRPILLPEGEVVEFEGLRLAGISGNLGSGKRWHHKTPEEFEAEAAEISEEEVDVLITHEPPSEVPFTPDNPYGKRVVMRSVRMVRPKLHVSGHVEYPTQVVSYEGIKFLHVSSQPPACEYAVGTFDGEAFRELKIKRAPVTPLGGGRVSLGPTASLAQRRWPRGRGPSFDGTAKRVALAALHDVHQTNRAPLAIPYHGAQVYAVLNAEESPHHPILVANDSANHAPRPIGA